jgi:hypothetical protein
MAVAAIAIATSLVTMRQSSTSPTDPIALAALLMSVVRPGPFANPLPGLIHLLYIAGLAVLVVALMHLTTRSPMPRTAFAVGAFVATMNALAVAPAAAQGGGLTGIFLLLPAAAADIAIAGLLAYLLMRVTRSVGGVT